jgi:hypothetical protein
MTNTTNPLTDIKNPAERRQRVNFWLERYAETPPLMTPENEHLKKNFPSCGDEGLRLKGTRAEFKERHDKLEWNARSGNPQDRERLNLTVATEQAVQHWQLDASDRFTEMQVAKSLEKLLDYDRRMGHPVADQARDLAVHPISPKEQAAWMDRDGREKTHDDISYEQHTDIFHHARTRSVGEGSPSKPGMDGDWSKPGRFAVMPKSIPDPRPSLDPEGPKMATFQALTQTQQQPELNIGEGVKERLAARRGLAM